MLATRDIKTGEKFYTILESGYDFEIVPRKKDHLFKAFKFTDSSVLEPVLKEKRSIYETEAKHLIYFLQHHNEGNIEVRNLHLPTPTYTYLHLPTPTYTYLHLVFLHS